MLTYSGTASEAMKEYAWLLYLFSVLVSVWVAWTNHMSKTAYNVLNDSTELGNAQREELIKFEILRKEDYEKHTKALQESRKEQIETTLEYIKLHKENQEKLSSIDSKITESNNNFNTLRSKFSNFEMEFETIKIKVKKLWEIKESKTK